MSKLKVNAIRHTSASSDAITLASDGTATAKITNRSSNLIINGSMICAQYGTSSTTAGYGSVDRFQGVSGGGEEACTHSQHALTSSDTGPWAAGFRNSFHLQNGNQTGGADAGDYAYVAYTVEAQDLANSGWDYTSASSYITLSFWVKCSVAGLQYAYFYCPDGTAQGYSFSLGNLSANTWTKVTAKIPGNSNLTFNNDNGGGMYIYWGPFWGTTYTDSGNTLNTWAAYSSSSRTPDFPSTWWTTNDAEFEITGVQLTATDYCPDFPHEPYSETLRKCQRYYMKWTDGNSKYVGMGAVTHGTEVTCVLTMPVTMRGTVAIDHTYGNDYWRIAGGNLGGDKYIDGAWTVDQNQPNTFLIYATPDTSLTSYMGQSGYIQGKNASSYMAFSLEL